MQLIQKDRNQVLTLPAEEVSPRELRHLNSELVFRIAELLKDKELYPKQIGHLLKQHEQKIYYHIRHMEKLGIIVQSRTEKILGSYAKYYRLSKKAFFFRFCDYEVSPRMLDLKEPSNFFTPFVDNGVLNAIIITGSPDPHGPDKARSRDGYYGIDLGLLIGTFLNYVPKPNVKLDTEVTETDLTKNLICIGGPIVNKVTEKVNSALKIQFERGETLSIKSSITGKSYPEDEMGVVEKAKNPFNQDSSILVVAGKRHSGTRAAIIAMIKHFDEVAQGNRFKPEVMARVVEGLDRDSDGIIDDVEFKE